MQTTKTAERRRDEAVAQQVVELLKTKNRSRRNELAYKQLYTMLKEVAVRVHEKLELGMKHGTVEKAKMCEWMETLTELDAIVRDWDDARLVKLIEKLGWTWFDARRDA